jgi:hypothetical protein
VNNYGLLHGDKSVTNCSGSDTPGDHVKFYAHTADGENGEALPESTGKWQPLATHLRNVAGLAKKYASPLGLPAEAELAGLLQGSASDSPAPVGDPPTGIVCSPIL